MDCPLEKGRKAGGGGGPRSRERATGLELLYMLEQRPLRRHAHAATFATFMRPPPLPFPCIFMTACREVFGTASQSQPPPGSSRHAGVGRSYSPFKFPSSTGKNARATRGPNPLNISHICHCHQLESSVGWWQVAEFLAGTTFTRPATEAFNMGGILPMACTLTLTLLNTPQYVCPPSHV